MNIVALIVGLLVTTMALMTLVIITLPAIIRRLKFMMARKFKKGIARMHCNDNRVRLYLRNFTGEDLNILKGKYIIDKTKESYEDGVPVLDYIEGQPDPIDIRNLGAESKLDSHQISMIGIRMHNLGKIAANKQTDLMMYLVMASTGASIGALALAWKILQIIQH